MTENPESILCPYCGHRQAPGPRCEECRGLFEPLSRRATQIAMGPWFIRDHRKPFRPGCSYEVLRRQIETGKVTPESVIRGPTTRQFWEVARKAPGVAHLVGFCHECGATVSPAAERCPECSVLFPDLRERNELGLLYPTAGEAAEAQAALDRDIAAAGPPPAEPGQPLARPQANAQAAPEPAAPPRPRKSSRRAVILPGADLLDEVIHRDPHHGSPRRGGQPTDAVPTVRPLHRERDREALPTLIDRPRGGRGSDRPHGVEALDFGPSDEAGARPGGVVPTGESRGLVRALAFLVFLLLAALIAVVVYVMQPKLTVDNADRSATGTATGGSPHAAIQDAARDAPTGAEPAGPTPEAPAAASPNKTEVTPSIVSTNPPTTFPVGPTVSPARSVNATKPPAAAPRPGSASATQPAAAKPAMFTPSQATIAARMSEARHLEDAGKLKDAQAILAELDKSVPVALRPPELDRAIDRVRRKIAGEFFEGEQ